MTFHLKFSVRQDHEDEFISFYISAAEPEISSYFYSLTSLFWSEHSAYITHNAPRHSLVGRIAGLAASEMVSFSTFSVPDSLVKFSDFVQ